MNKQEWPLTIKSLAPSEKSWLSPVLSSLAPVVDRALALSQLGDIYREITRDRSFSSGCEFLEHVHRQMNITYQVAENALSRIPQTGPLVVVANHPYGGMEATILLRLLCRIRPDVRFMANYLLGNLAETRDFCIYVDPFGGDSAPRKNLQPIRETISWVENGGVLCIFPAGTVSHLHLRKREITDPAWSPSVSKIIRKSGAPVVPIFFPGANGSLFQAAGVIHPLLRTVLLAREFYNKRGKEFSVKVGNLIPHEKLKSFTSDEELIAYLRLRTYILENQKKSLGALPSATAHPVPPLERKLAPIISPVDAKILESEIAKLPARQLLVDQGDNLVAYARAKQIPNLMKEIGRLREISFRGVQEGSGNELDVDRFDRYYTHLFIWNKENREIVGAYRIAKTDLILKHFGKKGLYTSTLFAYRTALLKQMGPALELGRSFVRHEYQKNFTPLLLLWKGIGQYVLRNPRYKTLFGPVSINNEYDSISRNLITTFLKANNYLPELARLIKARNPMGSTKVVGMDMKTTSFVVKNIADVSDLLQDIESRQKTIPVLLKQYLKLGGKLLGFNIDSSFGDVLDGLIFVDLLETDFKLLERYMGRAGAEQFLSFHGKIVDPSAESATA